ncbi:hypothetical protein Tco_0954700 [Tanacetum coccineum]|uniref:Uncharacterized protein n=1 Tax=Tanacetum coccineum TaxID=301880 RepID=A0ABQ5E547_9ASTR
MHWTNPFKDFEWYNVPGIKPSSFSESDDTFTSLQALSNLNYLFSGFMDYFWSCKLNISNFCPTNRILQWDAMVRTHGLIGVTNALCSDCPESYVKLLSDPRLWILA